MPAVQVKDGKDSLSVVVRAPLEETVGFEAGTIVVRECLFARGRTVSDIPHLLVVRLACKQWCADLVDYVPEWIDLASCYFAKKRRRKDRLDRLNNKRRFGHF